MNRPTGTVFPGDIDDRVYFSDVSLKHADVLEEYSSRMSAGEYQSASQYLASHKNDVDYYGADIFNIVENRLVAIETYARDVMPEVDRGYYGSEEPSETYEHMIWVA